MAQKPSIPKGTRDFGPVEMSRRNYIFDTISRAFRLYGYEEIQTPSMENLSTLMGKYGEEGDKLLFKILNSGDYLRGISDEQLAGRDTAHLTGALCEKGLRYDLTVPFARYVVQHRGELQMPFKRYQIQPVWRADRPQKGRYREFYQCDADVVGSDSLSNEVELLSLLDYVFGQLGIRIAVKVNNRKILSGIGEVIGHADKIVDITVAIDKIDKIGLDAVCDELRSKGIDEDAIRQLVPVLELSGSNADKIAAMRSMLSASQEGMLGMDELQTVVSGFDALGHTAELQVDLSLARGLNYYTGTIIEVKALDVEIGSISGGGRYDNLTGVFGVSGLSGVGVSFGADRIYDVLNQLDLYPEAVNAGVQVLFANFGEREGAEAMKCADALRRSGTAAMVYPDAAKMKKQMSYANAKGIPYVAIIGEEELAGGVVTLKNMVNGSQEQIPMGELAQRLGQ